MLFARQEIKQALSDGHIAFDPPISDGQIGETSIDLRLGHTFVKLRDQPGITVSPSSGLSSLKGLFDTQICPVTGPFGREPEFTL